MGYPMSIDTLSIQQFKEVTWGTAGTATVRVRGIEDFTIKPDNKTERLMDRRGLAVPSHHSRVLQTGVIAEESGALLYQDCIYLLEALFGNVAPTGAGPYTRNYSAPIGTFATLISYSRYYGDPADQAGIARGLTLQKLNISGDSNSLVRYKATWVGKSADTGTANMVAEASVAEIAIEGVLVAGIDTLLYIDAWGGTIGTTQISTTAMSFELDIDTQRSVKRYLDNKAPLARRQPRFDGTLKLAFEANTTALTYADALVDMSDNVQYQVRLKMTSGADILQFDFAGVAEEAPELYTDMDGDASVEFELKGKYNATLGNWLKCQSVSGVSSGGLL